MPTPCGGHTPSLGPPYVAKLAVVKREHISNCFFSCWFVLLFAQRQGIQNFARRVGRGQSNWETLIFDVAINGSDAHFEVAINQKGEMVRRALAVLLLLLSCKLY